MDYAVKSLEQLRPLLISFRKQAKLSQAQVAQQLGITQQAYARIESNPSATSVERLFTIVRLLGGSIAFVHTQQQDSSQRAPQSPPRLMPPSGTKENW